MEPRAPRPPKPRRPPTLHKKRTSGYYYAVFYNPERVPARKWVALETTVQRQAQRAFGPMSDAYVDGTWDPWRDEKQDTGPVSLADAIARFGAAHPTWRPVTRRDNIGTLGRFARSLPPGVGVADVLPADVARFLGRPPDEGANHFTGAGYEDRPDRLADQTQATYYGRLAHFFGWCLEERLIDASPLAKVPRPRPPKRPPEHLTPPQFDRLLQMIEADAVLKQATGRMRAPYARQLVWARDVIALAVYTGLRMAELHRLRWRDIDLDTRTLFVRNTAAGRTKSSDERPVPLVRPAVELLERLSSERVDERMESPVLTSPVPFPDGKPRPFSPPGASKHLRLYARKIGADPRVHFHSLRKTTGTWLASRGVPMHVIQRVLGHSTIQVTSDIYAGVWEDSIRSEMERAFDETGR